MFWPMVWKDHPGSNFMMSVNELAAKAEGLDADLFPTGSLDTAVVDVLFWYMLDIHDKRWSKKKQQQKTLKTPSIVLRGRAKPSENLKKKGPKSPKYAEKCKALKVACVLASAALAASECSRDDSLTAMVVRIAKWEKMKSMCTDSSLAWQAPNVRIGKNHFPRGGTCGLSSFGQAPSTRECVLLGRGACLHDFCQQLVIWWIWSRPLMEWQSFCRFRCLVFDFFSHPVKVTFALVWCAWTSVPDWEQGLTNEAFGMHANFSSISVSECGQLICVQFIALMHIDRNNWHWQTQWSTRLLIENNVLQSERKRRRFQGFLLCGFLRETWLCPQD